MTAARRDVRSVTISESADAPVYESPETWQMFGIGRSSPDSHDMAQMALLSFRDAVERLAASLHTCHQAPQREADFTIECATAASTSRSGPRHREGHPSRAARWLTGVTPTGVVPRSDVAWYPMLDLNCDWQFLDDHRYRINVDGEPGLDTRVRFLPPGPGATTTGTPRASDARGPLDSRGPRGVPGILGLDDAGPACCARRSLVALI